MASDRIAVTNRTGLTIWTSEHSGHPSVALGNGTTVLPRSAWEHTLACDPGLLLHDGLTFELVVDEAERSAESASPAVVRADVPSAERSTPLGFSIPPVLEEEIEPSMGDTVEAPAAEEPRPELVVSNRQRRGRR